MSAPQPPSDDPTRPDHDAPRDDPSGTYQFHGEELDFDPYRFGRPEPTAPTWSPTTPATDGRQPPAPGERWSPGGEPGAPDPRPGDYWNDPASGGVFPPPGYPPAGTYPPPAGDGRRGDDPAGRVDLGKPAADRGAPTVPPPGAYPGPGSYPPPGPPSYLRHPTGYPTPQQPGRPGGNGLALSGFIVGLVGLLLAVSSWPGIVVGLVGLGLSIAGLVQARRGAPRKGFAVAGLVCSVAAVVLGSIVLAVVLSRVDFDCVVRANGDSSQAQNCIR